MGLQTTLVLVVQWSCRHARLVLPAGLAIAVLCGLYAAWHLGVTTDTDKLFADSLPWRQRQIAFDRAFPQNQNLLVAVVDARLPEQADATAAALAERLAADTAHFQEVRRPDALPFFAREGLLFLDRPQLEELLNRTIDAQPFLGQLVADPSARGLFAALSLLGMGAQQGQANLAAYAETLHGFHDAIAAAAAGHPRPLSWQRLLGGSLAAQAGSYRFVLARPKLDYTALEPGGTATRALREAAAGLEFVASGDAHVRVTGSVALADEEFATVAEGVAAGTAISLVLITLWLFLAVRSWRMVVPIVVTLLLGFFVTTGFAALAVGTLNLISVAFAILFVGIAVDFAIQFCVRHRESRFRQGDAGTALSETARRVGGQILIAAAATAAGFYAFLPTDFAGVAELGLIAGTGMLIAFAATLLYMPALLTLFRPPAEAEEVGFAAGNRLDRLLARNRAPVLTGFAALAILGALLLPRLSFDSDPLHTKNPNTEAMRTLSDLLDDPLTNPYSIDVLAPSAEQAAQLATRLRALPRVGQVLTVESFVPEEQPAKLALIADAASLLGPTLTPRSPAAPVTPEQIRLAIATALSQIDPALPKLAADSPLRALAADLHALSGAPASTLTAMNAALTRFLPGELARLRDALQAAPVTLASLPPSLRREWLLPDGRARVQVMPKQGVRGNAELRAFVAEVRAVAPEAGGSAVTIVDTSDTIIGAFRTAAIGALLAIAAILFLALRRVLDVALVMAPLLLSALLTVLAAVLLPLPLNFANIIALPLLLGVGVAFNIYFVMNWRAGERVFLGSATARAVLFSALTTGTAFGSLALSGHPGTASMGALLLLSLGCTLIASLVFAPTLLAALPPPPAAQRKETRLTAVR